MSMLPIEKSVSSAVGLDFGNAVNTVNQAAVIKAILDNATELEKFVHRA